MTVDVKILADSICNGHRLTTFELRYPRMMHCFDESTEILSRIGDEIPKFRSFEAVETLGAEVAQYEPSSGEISFVDPIAHIKQSGTFPAVRFPSKKFPFLATEGHRMFSLRRTTGNVFVPHVDLASDYLGDYSGQRRILKSGYFYEGCRLSKEEISLIVYYVADGHKRKKGKDCQFHLRKERKVLAICNLMSKLGIEFEKRKYGEDTVIVFEEPWFVCRCYNDKGEKILPREFASMSQEEYLEFKETLFLSDGNIDNQEYNTTSQDLAEQIQVIALMHNDAVTLRWYSQGGYKRLYKFKFQDTNYASLRSDKDVFEGAVIEGTVRCVEVPTGFIFVRRDGVAYITGNCELLTHRMFSRCSSSTRAIPLKKQIEKIQENMAIPYWTMNQPGMQGVEADMKTAAKATAIWKAMFESVRQGVCALEELGIHKQDAGRALEPWSHISTVLSATDWHHFMDVRLNPDVYGIMRELAERIRDAILSGVPTPKSIHRSFSDLSSWKNGWHLPYMTQEDLEDLRLMLEDQVIVPGELGWMRAPAIISAARCARVSYLNHGGGKDLLKDWELGLKLIKSRHWSPLEHAARPFHGKLANFVGWAQLRQITEGLFPL